ncbi:protein PSK SIMULATOR 1-like isoform X2 [Primulina huaijiensis]|uniref:protein PSK SIMULATOR 1-like isoform X2 n=1 Tax=Primulina huaijiensis TaxID=1492673 RepID=UPI003CC74C94
MGGLCSKQNLKPNPYAGRSMAGEKLHHERKQVHADATKVLMTPPTVKETMEKHVVAKEYPRYLARNNASSGFDEFYDGIPRYQRSASLKSRSWRATKVSDGSSGLGRVGSFGLERTLEVLGRLGSSASLTGGFVSGTTATKTNKLSILAFEVANTILKASTLMQSLSRRSIRQLKEVVFPAVGVQQLISQDMDELLRIVAADKREELKVFSGEVVRFGNRCKDPQWHDLDRFFEKRSRNCTPQNQSRELVESMMLQLMSLVQLTAELQRELHTLDRLEQDYQFQQLEELKFNAAGRGDMDRSLTILAAELKSQRKLVKNFKKKSLWSKSMEEVMEKLVDIVLFLNQEISNAFGNTGSSSISKEVIISVPKAEEKTPEKGSVTYQQKLGSVGLALHYANIILQIDAIAARSDSMPPNSRDTLYQSLTPNFKASLRSKTHFSHLEKKPNVADIKDEMEKTLCWLVPMATNTVKAHHGFGWVGEWANTGTVGAIDVMQMETLHHADRQKTEAYILELLLWLDYLVNQSKSSKAGIVRIDTSASFSQNSSRANHSFQHDMESRNQDQEISKA